MGRENVLSLVPTDIRVYPVGRLDKDTTGLLILTNDGALTHKLIHPKYHVPKTYRLTIFGVPTNAQLMAFRKGVLLEDGITSPAEVSLISQKEESSILEVILHEGRNRQIRRMCETVGIGLLELERIAFGPLTLGSLASGTYRKLRDNEVLLLRKATEKT